MNASCQPDANDATDNYAIVASVAVIGIIVAFVVVVFVGVVAGGTIVGFIVA